MSSSSAAARVITTVAIWGLFTTMMGFVTLSGNVDPSNIIWIVLILAIASAISTAAIWESAKEKFQPQFDAEDSRKAKRNAKERLASSLNALDDDEAAALLEDFKSRLAGGDSDGEVSAVDMLRAERAQRG